MNLEDYEVIELRDCNTDKLDEIILLNKKHSVEEFQKAIYEAKNKHYEDIQENGDDWYYISQEIKDKFDYIEICSSSLNFVEY